MKQILGIFIIIILGASMVLPWVIWYGLGIDNFPWLIMIGNLLGLGFIIGIVCHLYFFPDVDIPDRMAEDMGLNLSEHSFLRNSLSS